MRNFAIIPARAGSTRIPGKNSRIFHGKPIIEYTIEAALRTGLFEDIIVSTDSQEIIDISKRFNVQSILRSADMCKNNIGTQSVIAHVVAECAIMDGLVCCLYPTAPLMSPFDIGRGYRTIMANPDKMFAFSVGTDPLQDAGQFYWGRARAFISCNLFDDSSVMVPIDSNRVCDINVEQDWVKAEQMYAKLTQEGKI